MTLRVTAHNSISLDGSILGFPVDIGLHYAVASRLQSDLMLVGSVTARTGIETYLETVPPETEVDRHPPQLAPDEQRPYWAIPDSRGALHGLLHVLRQSGYCRDIIPLLSDATPPAYVSYLKERGYPYIVAGADHVDCRRALPLLEQRFQAHSVTVDSGGTLTAALLRDGLLDALSLIVAPVLVGAGRVHIFRALGDHGCQLRLTASEPLDGHLVWLRYDVLRA